MEPPAFIRVRAAQHRHARTTDVVRRTSTRGELLVGRDNVADKPTSMTTANGVAVQRPAAQDLDMTTVASRYTMSSL